MPSCPALLIPVRDEGAVLGWSVPAVVRAVGAEAVRVVWICNGCTDGSAALIAGLVPADSRFSVIQIAQTGKTRALQAGDDLVGAAGARIYLDADTVLQPGDIARLLAALDAGAELAAAHHAFDLCRASPAAQAIARCWLALPHAREAAFLGAIALSPAGRARFGTWPDITGDDIYLAAQVPPERRVMVAGTKATTFPPATFGDWVRTRARWRRGERELAALGQSPPRAHGQRAHLLAQLLRSETRGDAVWFIAARIAASLCPQRKEMDGWRPLRRKNSL